MFDALQEMLLSAVAFLGLGLDALWAVPLTIITFLAMRKLARKLRYPIFNPFVLSLLLLIPLLLLLNIPYERYRSASLLIHETLQIGVVSLAYPLYKQLPDIIRRWKVLLSVCFLSAFIAMISGVAIVWILGGNNAIAASVLPKSVTTPIALVVSGETGGIAPIAAACVMVAGIFGVIFGHTLLNAFHIKSKAARGLAIGATAHVIGTARCNEVDKDEGAFSSLALVLCGIFTALTAPFIWAMLLKLKGMF